MVPINLMQMIKANWLFHRHSIHSSMKNAVCYGIYGTWKDSPFLAIFACFLDICVFRPLNPYSSFKFITNRFSVVRPKRPNAGLLVTPCGSKVMADCRFTHHTSHCCFWWDNTFYNRKKWQEHEGAYEIG